MKIALIIIPEKIELSNPDKYFSDCINYVIEKGYFPLFPEIFYKYMDTDNINKLYNIMMEMSSAVFLFIDFGITEKMAAIVKWAIKRKILIKYAKLSNILSNKFKLKLELEGILFDVSNKTKIPINQLKSKSRLREVVDARYIFFRRAKEVLNNKVSITSIGKIINLTHASVIHGIREANQVKEIIDKYNAIYGKNIPK